MQQKLSSAEIPKRSKGKETSMRSTNSSPTISSITPLNLEPRPIRRAFESSTLTCARRFPDFHAEIHWQLADRDRVTTYKTYHGTHDGPFLGIAPPHRKIHFES